MLNLILSKDWTVGRAHILNLIAEDVKNRKPGRILMVPELISHDTERRLCETAGDTASRYAEVLSFTRLARRVADIQGRAAQECLDNGGRVVAMAAAARQLHSRLKAYASVETKPEFLTELVEAVDEFKRCCITSADLLHAAGRTQGSLAQKLEELSLLLEAYDSLCARGKRDPRDQETQLLEQLEAGDFGGNHVLYIDGFPDFTRQHLAILEHLIKVSPSVTVSMNCDCISSDAMAFEKPGSTAAELVRCARRAGVEVRIQTLALVPSPLNEVREKLFQGRIAQDSAIKSLEVYQTDSIYQECQAAAQRIIALVRSGCRYRDIGVVCTDMNAYRSVVDLVFGRCGIPAYLSGTEEIIHKSVVVTVISAMEAALGGMEQRDVLRYLKSVLSPLGLTACDVVENYAITWGVSGKLWQEEWKNHPDGLEGNWNEHTQKRLEELNSYREKAITPLIHLRDNFAKARTLAEQVKALYAFLEEIELARRMAQLASRLDQAGDNCSAQILNQLWEILLSALEQLYDVLGDTSWDAETFQRLFTLLLSQYDVGTIPPVLDSVTVGPVSAMRCQEQKHLFVLGAGEGNLPGYGGSKGVLTDQERVILRGMGVPLTGGAMEGLQAEFSEIYGVFCGARETVTVSCPDGEPSFVYRRLTKLAGGESSPGTLLGAVLADPVEAGAYLAQENADEEAQMLGVRAEYETICSRRDHALGKVAWDNVQGLYGEKLNLSASQVDRQAECRLSYFLKYGLRARERKEATIDPAEFGTYVHAVLEETGREIMGLGGFHQVSLEQTQEIAAKHSAQYARERFSQIDSKRSEYLFDRNGQELKLVVQELWQELSRAAFQPVDFETAFGDDGAMPAIAIPSGSMEAQLRGFVDRVDAWQEFGQNYFRVVDYKTGKKDFDYCDVFNGIGLQMLLYLFALEQKGKQLLGEHPVSAGVQYFPARVPVLTSDGRLTEEEAESLRRKEWKRKGLLLSDEAVLQAMEPEEDSGRLCCTRKKDGTLTGDIADREQLRQLEEFVFRVLGRMVDDIASGTVEPNPYTRGTSHNACAFCPYGAICHKNQVAGRRNYKAMTAQRFWEEIGKELNHHG